MGPQFTTGVFSQKAWRQLGAGPLDDCWIMADLMAVHGCAPWLGLPGGTAYRAAAGVPDTNTGSEGGPLGASLKAVAALYPKLGAKIYNGSAAGLLALIKAGHPASVSVLSSSLPANLQFGYTVGANGGPSTHRIAVFWNLATLLVANPLAPPHSYPIAITDAALTKALVDYPTTAEANALVFPTADEAFKTHPLYVAPQPPAPTVPTGATPEQVAAAVLAGRRDQYDADLVAANASPVTLGPRP